LRVPDGLDGDPARCLKCGRACLAILDANGEPPTTQAEAVHLVRLRLAARA
jgi:hypothetical protein